MNDLWLKKKIIYNFKENGTSQGFEIWNKTKTSEACSWLYLSRLDILVRLHKEYNLCVFLFAYLHIKPLLKGIYTKRKEFAPKGSKFFPSRVDPFSEFSPEREFLPL